MSLVSGTSQFDEALFFFPDAFPLLPDDGPDSSPELAVQFAHRFFIQPCTPEIIAPSPDDLIDFFNPLLKRYAPVPFCQLHYLLLELMNGLLMRYRLPFPFVPFEAKPQI